MNGTNRQATGLVNDTSSIIRGHIHRRISRLRSRSYTGSVNEPGNIDSLITVVAIIKTIIRARETIFLSGLVEPLFTRAQGLPDDQEALYRICQFHSLFPIFIFG